ncbi:UDP-N-acetylmuramate:L-alanyl-gamma-D-glutamyl-meso-diaminopimelate ligase [hydrothermal vent metagenome]|uniref:UDP-N-acetylmuramate:L-alanyl-gamma-D-glutamyl-meso-diaminopimelate ligase n=1 Tax=hydrothermal vent metagenome TaxID=652676 RepID=A0A3B1CUH6_9ZZZZ
MATPERIHMIAICGTGMAALAGMLKKAGHHVTGSDQSIYPPMSTLLTQNNIACKQGYAPEHIEAQTDRVIIGNAVSKDNSEVIETLKRKLPYLSMASALETYFLEDKKALVVAGTHGKTTTSALLASILVSAEKDPTALIGGWVKNFNSNHRLGDGSFFVIEGDEYDTAFFDKGPKFLHYRPQNAILTSIEFDHADIFKDLSAILQVFQQFVRLIPQSGILLAEAGSSEIDQVLKDIPCQVERYGTELDDPSQNNICDWQARAVKQEQAFIIFEVWYQQRCLGRMKSPLIGRHNLKNTLAVIALCHHLDLSWPEIQKGLLDFKGIKRRQEIVGTVNDIIVMDDFAHHPTAIAETLAALRLRYPSRRLWAIFEPRSATSRRNIFQAAFVQAFRKADHTVLAAPFATEKIPPEERLNPEKIITELRAFGKAADFIPSSEEILDTLHQQVRPGDLICIMSSGGFDGLHKMLLDRLNKADAKAKPA